MPSSGYSRDPLDILIARENKTCKGCVHEQRILIGIKSAHTYCELRKPYGQRCKKYEEKKDG